MKKIKMKSVKELEWENVDDISIDEIYDTIAYKIIERWRDEFNDYMVNDIFEERRVVNLLYPYIKAEVEERAKQDEREKIKKILFDMIVEEGVIDVEDFFNDFEKYLRENENKKLKGDFS